MAIEHSTLAVPGPSLGALFLDASTRHADRLALEVDGKSISYAELAASAGRIARVLSTIDRARPRLGAVFAARSEIAYAGVLGTLLSGAGYVPLNPKFPVARTAHMLNVSAAPTIIVGAECVGELSAVLDEVDASRPLLVVLPTIDDASELAAQHPNHRFVTASEVAAAEPVSTPPAVDPAEIAYLLFTSGSTGAPKGVMVSHANVLPFVEAMQRRYAIMPSDRFSQTFDLTFDLSVFDMFVCWAHGASLHCIPDKQLMIPDEFVRSHALTVWFSVPSLGMMLRNLRRLTPNAFPALRWSLFCGERLPVEVAEAWQVAAPQSVVENLYGPTEATIACTLYRWTAESKAESTGGAVPIGLPYPGMTAAVVDDALALVGSNAKGELCMKGPQVTHGYWQDPTQTSARFVAMPWYDGPDNRWYRTGDIAYINDLGNLIHCGRNDDQIKIRGYRIELAEIEHAVRRAANTDFVVVVPVTNAHGAVSLTAVIAGSTTSEADILAGAATALPDYMVPGRVVVVPEMPLNANGKIDRKGAQARLVEHDQQR